MSNSSVEKKKRINTTALIILIVLVVTFIISIYLTITYPEIIVLLGGIIPETGVGIFEIIYVTLSIATNALYIFGAGAIAFGATLIIVRFFHVKTKDPYQKTSSAHQLSAYLTLGLNFFIGGEIIRTVAVRGLEEFYLLILTIVSRGLLTFILYLEERWHGTAEGE